MAASSVSSAVVDTPGGVNIPINVEAITQPVTETSRRIYQKVADGAQWYGEQWEDLLVEARHMALGANAQREVADVLAGLASVKVASDLPGRLRVRLKELRWQEQLAAQCTQALGSLPGIRQVEVSTITGSILVHYDTGCYPSSVVLLNAMAAA